MNKKFLGTEYGGWEVDLDKISDGDFIIDAGLGEDISFIEEIQKIKKLNVIGVDPTEKSHRFVESKTLSGFSLIKKSIAPRGVEWVSMHRNSNPNHVSESYNSGHGSVDPRFSYESPAISLSELISEFSPSLVKMDIEGAEYDVLEECIGVDQICVEFHHHCMKNKTFEDTKKCIDLLLSNGYEVISCRNNIEFTFLKK